MAVMKNGPVKLSRSSVRAGAPLRGAALVEKVIARIKADEAIDEPEPVPPKVLERLKFPNGKPLSPGLRAFLAFDSSWVSWFSDPGDPEFEPMSVSELVEEELEGWGEHFKEVDEMLPGDCFLLPGGCDSRRFLYVGAADSFGEYPVFVVDTDDVPWIALDTPGFDVWIAREFGVVPEASAYGEVPAEYVPHLNAHAKLNFGGRMDYECGSEGSDDSDDSDADAGKAVAKSATKSAAKGAAKAATKGPAKAAAKVTKRRGG
jgi:hypothetical protein